MRRRGVEIIVDLFDIFAVIALGIREPKETLLQNRILAIPKGERQAETLQIVRDAGKSIFAPAIGAAACMFVGEVLPRFAIFAVIFADCPLLPLAEVRSPIEPGFFACTRSLHALRFFARGVRLRRHRSTPVAVRRCGILRIAILGGFGIPSHHWPVGCCCPSAMSRILLSLPLWISHPFAALLFAGRSRSWPFAGTHFSWSDSFARLWHVSTVAFVGSNDVGCTAAAGRFLTGRNAEGPMQTKIVLVAGSNFYKPGEHEYIGGCAALMDLLRQTPGVFPVLAVDWPQKPTTFAGAKAVVFFLDGGDKHPILNPARRAEVQKLAEAGVGLVELHQGSTSLKTWGKRCSWMGAAFEKGYSQRAHWVTEFNTFPDHPICRGVTSFKIDDGWLFKLRFVPEMKGVTPLLRTVSPKAPDQQLTDQAIVSWAYDRPGGGRSFTFTGCHLHNSFAEEGYRRFLTNGILWTAGVNLPTTGAAVELNAAELSKYLVPRGAVSEK